MPEDYTTKAQRYAQEYKGGKTTDNAPTGVASQSIPSGLFSSALSSVVESFGLPKLKSAESFEMEHPGLATAGEVAGTIGLYTTPVLAKRKVKAFDDFVEGVAKKGKSPITEGALRNVATFAPLEAARVGGTALFDPENLGDTAAEVGVNLAVEAGAGALFGAFAAGGKLAKEANPAPVGSFLNDAPQLKLRDALKRYGEEGLNEASKIDLRNQISNLERDIRLEQVGNNPVSFKFTDPDADSRDIARLFKDTSSPKGNVKRRRIAQAANGFSTEAEYKRVLKLANLEGNLDAVSLPRHISFGRASDATKVHDDFLKRGKMQTLDDNTLFARTEDGTYLITKKIVGRLDKADPTDEYVVFRTSDPGRFSPEVKEFADKINERMMFMRTEDRITPTGNSILDRANRIVAQTPVRAYQDAAEKLGLGGQTAKAIARGLGFGPGEVGSNFVFNRGKHFVEHYLTPSLNLFKKGAGAEYASKIWSTSRFLRDEARAMSQVLINGDAVENAAKGFIKVFGDPTTTGTVSVGGKKLPAVQKILDSLSNEDITKFGEVAEIIAGGEDAIKAIDDLYGAGEISATLRQGLKDINELDKYLVGQVRAGQRAAGDIELNPLEGHLMMSRVWEGDFRAPVFNKNGELVYMASGRTPARANAHAKAVIDDSGIEGLRFEDADKFDAKQDLHPAFGGMTSTDEYALLAKANARLVRDPQSFKERTGIGGFKKEFTRKELRDRLTSHINERTEYMAGLATRTALDQELATLRELNPRMFATLTKKLEQLQETPGPLSKGINKATDALLKPVLGRNSATKISAAVNEFFFATQLGMGNVAFPVLNGLTFVQTVIPEAAYIMNAPANRIMRDYYEVAAVAGKDLKPRGGMHFLSVPKVMMQSFKKIFNVAEDIPLSEGLDRAVREGVVDPKLLEEFIGKSSIQSATISDVLKGEESISNLIRSLSGWLPSKSERFARGHSFVVGHMLGKDILGLSDEALYQFSKKFTERTMYNYGTADRALVMTGPVGRTFGLFKNWQTHYLFSMMQYGEEALKYGNWSPLLWQMGGTGMIGGISALPLYGVADSFSKMATNESLMTNTYAAFGGTNPDGTLGEVSDAVFLGLPAFLGVSLSGNASAPGSDPMRDAAQLASFPQWRRMVQLGEAVGEAFDQWNASGNHPITSPAIRDKLTAALAPKIWARSAALTNEAALRSLNTGKVVLNDLSLPERMMWRAGFTPRRVGVTYEAADELWKDQTKRRNAVTTYGKAWMEAQAESDWDTMWSIQQKAMVLGIPIDSIVRSADTQREKRSTELIQRQFSPESRARLQSLGVPGF